MTPAAERHLDDDRIARALVSEGALTHPERRHLDDCRACGDRIHRLRTDLERLGAEAARLAPVPSRAPSLPEGRPGTPRPRPALRAWGLGLAAAAALVAALVLSLDTGRMGPPVATVPRTVAEDPEMIEVRMLAENAMPLTYQAISESIEFDPEEAEGFIDFLIPPLEEDVS